MQNPFETVITVDRDIEDVEIPRETVQRWRDEWDGGAHESDEYEREEEFILSKALENAITITKENQHHNDLHHNIEFSDVTFVEGGEGE